MSSKKSHYIVIIHAHQPAEGSHPEMKDFGEKGQWTMNETVYFVDKLKPRHMDSASVVIDYDNWKVLKDRTNSISNPQQMLDHVQKNYPQQFKQFMDIVIDVKPKK